MVSRKTPACILVRFSRIHALVWLSRFSRASRHIPHPPPLPSNFNRTAAEATRLADDTSRGCRGGVGGVGVCAGADRGYFEFMARELGLGGRFSRNLMQLFCLGIPAEVLVLSQG